jgi:hypothetical protein
MRKIIKKNLFSTTPRALKKGIVVTLCMMLTGLVLLAGCKKDNKKDDTPPESEYPIEIPFTEYSLAENCQWTNLAYDDKVIVINNDETLKQYVACTGDGYPEIDFSENSLLLANGKTGGISKITVSDLQQLSSDKYELYIEILLDGTYILQHWTVALIVKKMSEESKVELNTIENYVIFIGKTWVLVEKEMNAVTEMLPDDDLYPITLTFQSDTTFHGRHDANIYRGEYNMLSNNILLRITGVTDVGDIKWYRDYLNELESISKMALTDSTMRFSNNNNSLIFNFVSKEKFEKDYFELEEWYNF